MNIEKNYNINEKFERRKSGVECPMCPDTGDADLVAELPSGRVHLQNDADYRGYCILIFRRHAVEIHDLTKAERGQWIEDLSNMGRAISEVCAPAKLNVTMLGNMAPHLHCHIMPRYPEDPDWGRPPAYRRPSERRPLSTEEYESLRSALRAALSEQ
jgi:diadenosine tetraphosphate (Ap4A) HIT family hydrolase